MKEIRSDQVLETKVRIYSSYLLNRLNDYCSKHTKEFKNKNDLYVHLIQNGLELAEIQDENYEDYNGKFQSISDKLTEILNAIQDERVAYQNNLNDQNVNERITEKLLSRIYNLVFSINEQTRLNKDYVEAGMYDDLPEGIREFKNDLLEFYGKKKKKNIEEN